MAVFLRARSGVQAMTAIAGTPKLLRQENEYLRGEVERLRAIDAKRFELFKARNEEVERLRTLLKAAAYHVEGEGDVSLLTAIRAALENKP
jgi:hypothetical protein